MGAVRGWGLAIALDMASESRRHFFSSLARSSYASFVQVEGGDPGSVSRAYKKAVLHFHPDRHVNSPLPAQIYAEEAFKIISEASKS